MNCRYCHLKAPKGYPSHRHCTVQFSNRARIEKQKALGAFVSEVVHAILWGKNAH